MDEKDNAQQPNPDAQTAQTPATEATPQSAVQPTATMQTQPVNAEGQVPPQQPYQQSAQPVYDQQSYGQQPGQQPYGQQPIQQPGQPVYGAPSPEAPMTPPGQNPPSPTGALVCGILAILLCAIPIVGIVLGIAAIVLAGNYFKAGGTLGQGQAGRICGIIGIVLSIVMIIISCMLLFTVIDDLNSYNTSSSYSSTTSSSTYGDSGSSRDAAKSDIEDIVDARLAQLKNQDPAVVASLEKLAETTFNDAFEGYVDNITMESCGINPADYISLMLEGFDYKLDYITLDGTEEGDTAEAYYNLTIRSITDILYGFTDLVEDHTSELASMSEADQRLALGEYLIEATKNADIDRSFGDIIEVDLTFTNGEWVIDEEAWDEEMTYFISFQ